MASVLNNYGRKLLIFVLCVGLMGAAPLATASAATVPPGPSTLMEQYGFQVDAGGDHTCVVMRGWIGKCWGNGNSGALGDLNDLNAYNKPRSFGFNGTFYSVSSGNSHTCAITTDSKVTCWGDNTNGQLGGQSQMPFSPVTLANLQGVSLLSSGGDHTCAIVGDSIVKCWGRTYNSPRAPSWVPDTIRSITNPRKLTSGASHTCALESSGFVKCWGDNQSGQTGTQTSNTLAGVRVPVDNSVDISAGDTFSCSLLLSGSVSCWGGNQFNQLGNGTLTNSARPVPVTGVSGAVAISSGHSHTCALIEDGSVKCWGSNLRGQLNGLRTVSGNEAQTVAGIRNAVAISAGGDHTCASFASGSIKCWGDNRNGQIAKISSTKILGATFVEGFKKLKVEATIGRSANLSSISTNITLTSESAIKFSFQWYVSGKAIKGATKSTYKTKRSDIGKEFYVKITCSKSGFPKLVINSPTLALA